MTNRAGRYVIKAIDISSEDRYVYTFGSLRKARDVLGLSLFKLRQTLDTVERTNYLRSKDGKLYEVYTDTEVIVNARPELLEKGEEDFASAKACIDFLGISSRTYYIRFNNSTIGVECPSPVKDSQGYTWYLTFYTPLDNDSYRKEKPYYKISDGKNINEYEDLL